MSLLKEEKTGLPPGEQLVIKAVAIPSKKIVETTVFYLISVTSGFTKWTVAKRYSQFEELHTHLVSDMNGKALPAGCELPPKKIKWFTSHTDAEFIEERRCLLEAYLKKVLSVEKLGKSESLVKFLTSDKEGKEEAVDQKAGADKRTNGVTADEDVEVTGVSIPSHRTMSDHVLYQIDVVNNKKRKTFSKWTVLKRFGQFYEMDAAVRGDFVGKPDILATLPAAPQRRTKLLNDHLDAGFVEQRRVLLENYLQRMLENAHAVRDKHFLGFLGVTSQ